MKSVMRSFLHEKELFGGPKYRGAFSLSFWCCTDHSVCADCCDSNSRRFSYSRFLIRPRARSVTIGRPVDCKSLVTNQIIYLKVSRLRHQHMENKNKNMYTVVFMLYPVNFYVLLVPPGVT